MERAGRLIKNKQVSRELCTPEDLARAAWPSAVGKAIHAHTSRLRLVRDKLIVEVEDAIWQRQLHTLSHQILQRLTKVTGSSEIKSIEFRMGVPRREPQRAQTRDSGSSTFQGPASSSAHPAMDEADAIQDAVLKKVYRLSRKKETA